MNTQEILTLIRDYLAEPTAANWTDADLYRKINAHHQAMADDLIVAGQGYFARTTLVDYTSGTATYQMPVNLANILKMERVDTDPPKVLDPITLSEESEYTTATVQAVAYRREGYLMEANAIRIVPVPSATYTNGLRWRFAKAQPQLHSGVPTAMSASVITFAAAPLRGTLTPLTDAYEGLSIQIIDTGDIRKVTAYNPVTRVATVDAAWSASSTTYVYAFIPEIPDRWHHLLALGAAVLARKEKFDDANDLETELVSYQQSYKEALKPRQVQRSRQLHYVSP